MRRSRSRRGFTLIELLVVIAIIAILAAILFPVFMTAKAKAKQASCQSNGKQMAAAMFAYMSDWADTYPRGQYYELATNYYKHWGDYIDGYVKNKAIRECPALGPVKLPAGAPWSGLGVGVGVNPGLCTQYDPTIRASVVRQPTRTVLFADGEYKYPNGDVVGSWVVTGYPNMLAGYWNPSAIWETWVGYRHSGKANVVFADGHARAMTKSELMPAKDLPPNAAGTDSLWDWN